MDGNRAGLTDRLAAGPIVCAEGYLFELERRGYVQAGSYVPEVVLDHPEQVTSLHEQFVHAGSDVVEAFTYYAHREKLRMIGKEDLLAPMNRQALAIAADVASRHGALLAGDICNTNVYDPADTSTHDQVRAMFEEQVGWAADAAADFVIAETLRYVGEAEIALDVIRSFDLPAVVTLVPDRHQRTRDDMPIRDAIRQLADNGATVVGLNCAWGPATMLPLLEPLVAAVDVPFAALPVPYRTTTDQPTYQSLTDPAWPDEQAFPTGLDPFVCTRYEIAQFTAAAAAAGVSYFGLCCGAAPHHVRAMAETLGRTPPASRYSADMSKHVYLGDDPRLARHNVEYRSRL